MCTPLPLNAFQIGRQRGDQCFALASTHLGDVALVQHHPADQLYVERTQSQRPPRCLTGNREGFFQDVVKRLTRLQTATKNSPISAPVPRR